MPASSSRQTVGVSIAAAVILVAACLPWGEVDFRRVSQPLGGEMGDAFQQMFAAMGPIPVTVWNGHAGIGPLKLPNVLVLLAALGAAVVSWLTALSIWKASAIVPMVLAGYGLTHAAYVLLNLLFSAEGSPGVGLFLTVVAFTGMLAALVQQRRREQVASSSES